MRVRLIPDCKAFLVPLEIFPDHECYVLLSSTSGILRRSAWWTASQLVTTKCLSSSTISNPTPRRSPAPSASVRIKLIPAVDQKLAHRGGRPQCQAHPLLFALDNQFVVKLIVNDAWAHISVKNAPSPFGLGGGPSFKISSMPLWQENTLMWLMEFSSWEV